MVVAGDADALLVFPIFLLDIGFVIPFESLHCWFLYTSSCSSLFVVSITWVGCVLHISTEIQPASRNIATEIERERDRLIVTIRLSTVPFWGVVRIVVGVEAKEAMKR